MNTVIEVNDVSQTLVWIPAGEFLMGSPDDEPGRWSDEGPRHRVTVTEGYWLFDTPCTQALWRAVMGDNPSRFHGDERPVENVSWDQVQEFIERLNEWTPGGGFRLPTEAEWEYACRAGTTTPFSFGPNITPDQVNYNGNYPYAGGEKGVDRGETVPAASLPPNRWGLYEMHGNVWEWCQDWYGAYPSEPVTDPTGPAHGRERVLRGGSWFDPGGSVRSAYRDAYDPALRLAGVGFRLARSEE